MSASEESQASALNAATQLKTARVRSIQAESNSAVVAGPALPLGLTQTAHSVHPAPLAPPRFSDFVLHQLSQWLTPPPARPAPFPAHPPQPVPGKAGARRGAESSNSCCGTHSTEFGSVCSVVLSSCPVPPTLRWATQTSFFQTDAGHGTNTSQIIESQTGLCWKGP